ncbi:PLDc_N domain-containing protein [Pontibacter sp. KCTC 32443]|uniref:PLD nuclease N-terminal domain-containing protein n=1 Tax=Pontibacter TaxID=323449 RepID=UPI00164DC11F|nr:MULTISPECIES: PLD nuclease N-terminal domain-containing protein [Pontibacter]MBC5775990.1 PLDc_N domain-containing protein [Pontibacter sp. KCTC 32443]
MLETTLLFIGGIGLIEMLLILLILGIPVGLWLWAIIDLNRSNFADSVTKVIWLIVVAFIPILGTILYLLIGRRQKVKPVCR